VGILSKLFGAPEPESKSEETRVVEPPAPEPSPNVPPKRTAKSNAAGSGVPGLRDERIVLALVERLIAGLESITRIENVTTSLAGMLEGVSKSVAKSEHDRRQLFLDLRGHFTREIDELRTSLHDRMVTEGAIEVFTTLLPALDDMDHVLRETSAKGDVRSIESLRLVRRKLRDAFSRLGIEEIRVEEGVTLFDPKVHEGQPYDGDDPKWNSLPPTTIVQVQRMGYVVGEKVLRCTVVSVIKG
jgi:hypothetical protein